MEWKFEEISSIIDKDKGWPTFSKKITKPNPDEFKIATIDNLDNTHDAEIRSVNIGYKGHKKNHRKLKNSESKHSLSTLLDPNNLMPLTKNDDLKIHSATKSYIKGLDNFTEFISKMVDDEDKDENDSESESSVSNQSKLIHMSTQEHVIRGKNKLIHPKSSKIVSKKKSKRTSEIKDKSKDSKIDIDPYVIRTSTAGIAKMDKKNSNSATPNKSTKSK